MSPGEIKFGTAQRPSLTEKTIAIKDTAIGWLVGEQILTPEASATRGFNDDRITAIDFHLRTTPELLDPLTNSLQELVMEATERQPVAD